MLKLNFEPPTLAEVFNKHRSDENLRRGHAANRKGKTAEERVLVAADLASTEFSWLQSCRLATKAEDSRGIDVVASTAIGPLYIQVKSSHHGVRHYKQKRRKARVIIVIIDPLMSDEKVWRKVRGALCVQRNHILELRRRSAKKRKARP